jgi:hypothetical protein
VREANTEPQRSRASQIAENGLHGHRMGVVISISMPVTGCVGRDG